MLQKKFITFLFTIFLISSHLQASEECFEGTSRAVFKFNMALDRAVIEPIAKGYNKLPDPIKNGTSNFTSNIATLLSIPNHLAQGRIKEAGDATASFLINSTIGIIGLSNVVNFDSLEENSIDSYASFKSLYLQNRENKINNSSESLDDWGNLDN